MSAPPSAAYHPDKKANHAKNGFEFDQQSRNCGIVKVDFALLNCLNDRWGKRVRINLQPRHSACCGVSLLTVSCSLSWPPQNSSSPKVSNRKVCRPCWIISCEFLSALPRKLEPDFCVICVSAVMRANAGSKTTSSNRAFISSSMHLSAGCSNGKPSRIVGQQLVKGMSSSANKCHDRKSEDSLDRKDTGLAAPKAACSDAALAAQGQPPNNLCPRA